MHPTPTPTPDLSQDKNTINNQLYYIPLTSTPTQPMEESLGNAIHAYIIIFIPGTIANMNINSYGEFYEDWQILATYY